MEFERRMQSVENKGVTIDKAVKAICDETIAHCTEISEVADVYHSEQQIMREEIKGVEAKRKRDDKRDTKH